MKSLSLQKIHQVLESLLIKAREIDHINTQNKSFSLRKDKAIFAETLFSTNSDQLAHYVYEVQNKTSELNHLLSANKAQFFNARLALVEQQISAIVNAINANESQNKSSTKHLQILKQKKYRQAAQSLIKSSQSSYQKLAETKEFERRLLEMLDLKQSDFAKVSVKNRDKVSSELLVLHQRLGRCRQAISKIERQIEMSEKR
ncbi:primosomal replication protein PriC [Colwelliaceae bacterium 6441]